MTHKKAWLAAIVSLSALLPSQAFSITVDGNLSDWGLRQTGRSSDFTPTSGISYTNGDGIAPGRGGQTYDAEGIYTYMDSTYMYVALVTGLSPNETTYPAGDFAIDFGRDGSYEFGIETLGANKGSVYRVNSWSLGSQFPDPNSPANIATGTKLATGSLVYNSTSVTNMGTSTADRHYFMEAAIPLSAFSGFSGNFNIHWTMACGNDTILASSTLPDGGNGGGVPEPATLALLLIGLTALGREYRKQQIKAGQLKA